MYSYNRLMKRLLPLPLLLLLSLPARAGEAATREHPLGAGVIMGVPFGASAKYWLDNRYAGQAAFGWSEGDVVFSADGLMHFDNVLPKSRAGRLPLYAGLGMKLKSETRTFFGFRFIGGISFFATKHPLELFAEVGPVLRVAPNAGGTVDGGAGLRYYF